jgi:uncharacterized protein
MRIWVDADACPKVIKEVLFRAANRTKTPIILVANQHLSTPPSPYITKIQVTAGFDVADNRIIRDLTPGDVVITADIPLADAVVTHGGIAINPRGKLYSADNIKERLSVRNLSDSLRGSGIITGGPSALGKKEVQEFSNILDRILAKNKA